MVQKLQKPDVVSIPKTRGRPRSYEPDAALLNAMHAFWKSGYSATTLDDLSAATGMKRPSLYAAFGDKQDIYIKAYRRYREIMRDEFGPILEARGDIRAILRNVFRASAELYLLGPDGPRGCLTVMPAASDAMAVPDIRSLVVEAIAALDMNFTALFKAAMSRGELSASLDASALGRAATATLHTLAIRARSGCSRSELNKTISGAVELICRVDDGLRRQRSLSVKGGVNTVG